MDTKDALLRAFGRWKHFNIQQVSLCISAGEAECGFQQYNRLAILIVSNVQLYSTHVFTFSITRNC
jgi:hypothetical protein